VHNVTTSTAVSPAAPASEAHGATIIPFPVRKPAAATPVDDRLTVSLANLTAALEEQRAAVTAWQAVLRELKTTTAGLHDGLQKYSASLGTLGEGVSAVRERSLALEEWADAVVATHH
jgi:lipopolysaccharide biosynthesis regulator YciM